MEDCIYQGKLPLNGKRIAAIDIGSHTTRMLVAEYTDSLTLFKALERRRVYTHLAEGFTGDNRGNLAKGAVERTARAIKRFVSSAARLGVERFYAVSTGVARRADNAPCFMDEVKAKTGIDIKIISGEREAILTRRGVIYGSGVAGTDSSVIFDLGGATTEFIWGKEEELRIISLPIGALVLKQGFLEADPPPEERVIALSDEVDSILSSGLSMEKAGLKDIRLTGSGGTASTLVAVIGRFGVREITPERVNGKVLGLGQIEGFIRRIRPMTMAARQRIKGMEKGRAEVILAGALAVSGIMRYFNTMEMTASYSDILEGIIVSHIMEEEND